MIFLYSGASRSNSQQLLPQQSLGGYVSSSRVPNSKKNNIFGDITKQLLFDQYRQTRLIVLNNTTIFQKTLLKIWTEKTVDSLFIYKIAGIVPAYDETCGKYYFEQLVSEDELPYQSSLSIYDSVSNQLSLGTIDADKYIGIWISREVDPTKITNILQSGQNNQNISDDMIAYLEAQSEKESENFTLKLSYL